MLKFRQTKVAKEEFYDVEISSDKSSKRRILWCKKSIKIWDVDANNSHPKIRWNKENSKHLIGYLRPLVLILPKMSGHVKKFKDEGEDKNNKLMFLCIDDDMLLEKYKTIWIKIDDLK